MREKAKWRFIDSGPMSPAMNMAIDEAILTIHSQGKTPPTVRFYTWEPSTLSIGYFQKAEKEIDHEAVRKYGLGFVRRQTGGRAVLHDQELTYSVVVSESYPGMPTQVNEAYRVISNGLLEGFQTLGFHAEMVSLASEEEKAKYASMGSSACFDSPSWYELVVEGKKVAGSAQTRQKGTILQHGSILLDFDVDKLFNVLRFPSERVKERMKASFLEKAVAINHLSSRIVTLVEAHEAFYQGFEAGLGMELIPSVLTEEELELAEHLARDRYSHKDWNFKR
ncbi:biotin/lipoate A/B protein ligase family protein [Ammoniphilus sp. CFH 90114]|uniref:lipoate--protein ligase family protein n=1 Tax=Ammoniphilus sp. CFH 90114 TaxID=2493665 RepID=UPI00100FC376|nr:biotin/lipoate A/B protein ligase family protein [Ammoniphilus sp. CFH 90114]RXT13654.1 lipoate--protein ligase family protein [Ammoniphilus sp. CFH 90114]